MTNNATKPAKLAAIKADSAENEPADVAGNEPADSAENEPADSGELEIEDSGDDTDNRAKKARSAARPRRPSVSISISLRGLLVSVLIVVLAGATGTMTWLYLGAKHQLDAQARDADTTARVERIALDYAVNAATMDYKDLQSWKVKLVAGTSPQLNDKLTKAADSMEQILVPLQWVSTAQPLEAKRRSSAGGIYVVDCFVSVLTKTVQSPDGLQSTATYSVTIDGNQDFKITDVGGIGAAVARK